MSHAIHALVMTPADARSLVSQHAELRAYELPQGFAIVPLNPEVLDALAGRTSVAVDELARVLSAGRTFAEIETDYFGGNGQQRAAVWRDGQTIFSAAWREDSAINEALHTLGVRRTGSDQFAALALVRFRSYEAFERATPLPAATTTKIYAITDELWTRAIRGDAAFTPIERILLDVALVEADVNNGGLHQYFFNSYGDRAVQTVASLEAIGAPKTAAILREACGRFPDAAPSAERFVRQKQLDQIAPLTNELDDLNKRFFAYPEPLEQLMAAYWERHGNR